MAKPVAFQNQNDVLGPYPGTEQWVQPLPIYRQGLSYENGQRFNPCVVSCWEFTPQELAEIARTGRIYVQVHGATHAPLSIWGTSPFAQQPQEEQR